jgi:flagellar motor switch protein FliN
MSISQSDIDSLLSAADNLTAEAGPATAVATAPGPPRAGAPAPARPSAHRQPVAAQEVRRILKLGVPVIVKLAESNLPVSAVLKITSGSILEFDRAADSELELLVNNKVIAWGQAVKVSENFGLRITRLCAIDETIKALGQ